MTNRVKVLALASYPNEAAATRYRLAQLVGPLADHGIDLRIQTFLDAATFDSFYRRSAWPRTASGLVRSTIRAMTHLTRAPRVDVLLVQREAAPLGPPVIEHLLMRRTRCAMVLDLDDPTYLQAGCSAYGSIGRLRSWTGKTDTLIRRATTVTCGNQTIADYVVAAGSRAVVIPTVVDTSLFRPSKPRPPDRVPVLGWVGSHSTFPYLESLFPVLVDLARTRNFRLKVVGSGRSTVNIPGVEVEVSDWKLEREVEDFQSIDIGLYPLVPSHWAEAKSGLKSIQFMAVGVPFVVTPLGAAGTLGVDGSTNFSASTPREWSATLSMLIDDRQLGKKMGEAGRQHVLANYTVPQAGNIMAEVIRGTAG